MTTPRISVLVLAYNQAGTVDDAVNSVLAQVCEPVEIVLSDDASSDGTFARMQALAAAYRGPHQVRVRRNDHNLGIGGHYNAAIAASVGQLLVTAAGDDISLPHRVSRIAQAWDAQQQRPDLIASHLEGFSADGPGEMIRVDDLQRWTDAARWFEQRPYVVGAAHAFTRRLIDRFGPLRPDIAYEDQVLTFRGIASGGAITIDEVLVRYRTGGVSAHSRMDSAETFLRDTDRQNRRLLAENRQLQQDADRAGLGPLMQTTLARGLARETYVRALLDAASPWHGLRVCMAAANLPIGWRLRKWLYLRYPGVAATIRRVQRRHKERAAAA